MSSESYPNKKAVLSSLQASGWRISQSQFYQHCKEGLLRPGDDGTYAAAAVEKYARRWLRRIETGEKVGDRRDRIQEEKDQVDLETSRIKLEREKHDLGVRQRKFVSREDFELAIVARAVAFMAHLNHTVQEAVPDWIELVGGDQARAGELVHAISTAIERRMSDFAADAEFDVILEGEGD